MSSLGKFKALINFLKPGLIALIPVFLGCDTAEDFGTEFNLQTNVDVKVIDFTLPATNTYIDSLRTDSEDELLVGRYDDPLTGSIEAEGYFRFSFSSGTFPVGTQTRSDLNPPDTLQYDSMALELRLGDVLPDDITVFQSFNIVELEDSLQSNIVYLATTKQDPVRTIGSFSSSITPVVDSILTIKLDDSYGTEIFNQISDAARDSSRSAGSLRYKDLGIIPLVDSESLLTIDLSTDSRMRLFMSGNADSVYTVEFFINITEYSYVERDRSASSFSGIIENNNFDLSDGKTVLDPLAGITTAFSLEGIQSFLEDNDRILINSAEIDFEIDDNIPRDTVDFFRLYFRKANGGIFGPAVTSEQTAFPNIVMSDQGYLTLRTEPALASIDETTYEINPTLFFQTLYNNYQDSSKLIYIDPFQGDATEVNELVMVGTKEVTLQQTIFKNSGINLRVFYTETDVNQ